MRLHDKLITNSAILRQQFDFAELWCKKRLLVKEIGDIRPDLDRDRLSRLQKLLRQCVTEEGLPAETAPDILKPLAHWMEEQEEKGRVENDNAASLSNPAPWPFGEETDVSEGEEAASVSRGSEKDRNCDGKDRSGDEKNRGHDGKDRNHDAENWQSICLSLARAQGADSERKACMAASAFAIYSLCGVRFQSGDEEKVLAVLPADVSSEGVFEGRISKRDRETLAAEDGALIELEPRGEPYRIPVWDFASQGGNLARVLYRNKAPRDGQDVELLAMDGNAVMDRFLIKPGETLAVNLLDGLFVEAAPTLAISGSHCMFRDGTCRFGEEPFALKAYSFEEGRIISYEMPALKRLTEYAPDDSGGFIGVLSPEGLTLPCSEKTEFRRIYEKRDIGRILLKNATYLLLTKDGRVYSNLSRANGWSGMLRVFLSEDGDEAIGVCRDGSVISTRPDWELSGLEGAFLVKTDGCRLGAKLPGGRFLIRKINATKNGDNGDIPDKEDNEGLTNAPAVKDFSLGAYGARTLLMDGALLENGKPVIQAVRFKEYASEGDSFAAIDNDGALWIARDGRPLQERGGTDGGEGKKISCL